MSRYNIQQYTVGNAFRFQLNQKRLLKRSRRYPGRLKRLHQLYRTRRRTLITARSRRYLLVRRQQKTTLIKITYYLHRRTEQLFRHIRRGKHHGRKFVALAFMHGNRIGNFQFRTSTNQAPRFAQPGEPMEEKTVILELKLLADVGLVGFPNAGKSTLLSALSSARPKIANYPFTTLEPSLGIVSYHDKQSFVMADIPGIIEGASEGKGLGLRFLRHIERNSLLLFMVPGDTDDIKKEYEVLLNELKNFNPEMLDKHRVLAVTKCDLLDAELIDMLKSTTPTDIPVVFISAVTGQGLNELKDVLWSELNSESNKLKEITAEDTLVHRDKDLGTLPEELRVEGEDEIEFIDEDDIEDVDEDEL